MSNVELTTAMTMGSLFDGIGGFPLGAARYGIKTIWASEIEPFPMEVTKRRFPSMVHKGDITKLSGKLLFPVDIHGMTRERSGWRAPSHWPGAVWTHSSGASHSGVSAFI